MILLAFTFVLLTFQPALIESSVWNTNPCSTYKIDSMPGLEFHKTLGTWYNFLNNINYIDRDLNCVSRNYSLLNETYISVNRTWISENGTINVDSKQMGLDQPIYTISVLVKNAFSQLVLEKIAIEEAIIWTDYENVMVRAACVNLNNFWMAESRLFYVVMVRDRRFDSIKLLAPAIEALEQSVGFQIFRDVVLAKMNNCTIY